MTKQIDLEKYKESYLRFIEKKSILTLATLDENGHPFTSCTPFVKNNGKLYIYISQIAEHYQYLENSELSDVFLMADEETTKNPFATERVRLRCSARNIGNEGNDEIFSLFDEKFDAKMMTVFRGLDFALFELTPTSGRYVVGFGMAFNVSIDGAKFEHVVVDKKNNTEA
ncbi:HugZ family pyridoxamine 5'-phosphate oxidase [Bacillus ndiopicus]|uniref:HugZ family pyridoxamine 5'-phosphate oxidase n=1 Tax=Bacillus ndiopicus TaxID=1347368 RepID=UPI000693DD74|nr:pyridoxamine 5'-phosphate oxidase family protein [Bacillus ndiopicus]